jgi:lysyl-tRNA synthetase class 1
MGIMKPQSNYWIDVAVRDILEKYPQGEILVSSGISPSASYHIGHFREIMTADALTWGLKRSGREARHIHVVDNFDPLRKRYDFLPESYEQYVGWPISLVPDPVDACRDEHKTYAEHFYREFESYARQMGIVPDEVVRSYEQLYANGKMAVSIERAIERVERIKLIMKEVSNRELPDGWLPLQLLSPNNSFTELAYKSIDTAAKRIIGLSEDGTEYSLDYTVGQVKMNWRLDWPARWQVLGIKVEPFSAQEHGAAGGSYETGVRFDREIFDYEPPIPGVRYANIHMQGDTKKMSSSKGNLITPEQALQIMPPEVLRYFIVRSRPERTLYWESNQGLMNLLEEFSQMRQAINGGEQPEFAEAYAFATASKVNDTISSVPFNHLIQVWQTSQGNQARALEVLERTDFAEAVKKETDVLGREFVYVGKWLETYAPEQVKFSVQAILPQVELSDQQRDFLGALAKAVAQASLDGQGMHEAIYAAINGAGIKPGEAFKALYRIILGKDSGPKAGWFLASLDQAWLASRLALTS